MKLLEEVNHQRTTVIVVTHNPEIAAQADRTIHIEDGRIAE